MGTWIIIPIILPTLVGLFLLISSFKQHLKTTESELKTADASLRPVVIITLAISVAAALFAAWSGEKEITLFYIMKNIPIFFKVDEVASLFVTVVSIVWFLVSFYAFTYMSHEGEEKRFFGLYLVVYGVLMGLNFSGNLVTLYLFYELMTVTSMPMVLHNGSKEAIDAAKKYLFFSMCGAYMGLFGIFFLNKYCDTLEFVAGGTLNTAIVQGNETIILISVMAMLIGFGVKAGMFPLHSWLAAAHPVAPAPASAVLSSIIVKAGVMAIIRVVYYVTGAEFIRGTWVQYAWVILSLLTVFMGSMLAYKAKVFKRRLAYSTVSQVSYILFGLAVLTDVGMTGALLHVIFHAFIKCTLFLTAGIFIFQTGKTEVHEYEGIGRYMPKTVWCYTLAALALVGIPPASGFVSKWYLAQGAFQSNVGHFGWIGIAILLLSALLTAGYLLPITMKGFFTEKSNEELPDFKGEAPKSMWIPLMILAALTLLLGVFPTGIIKFVAEIAATVL